MTLRPMAKVGAATMTTHHFPWTEMVEVYAWLCDHPEEAGAVVFDWDADRGTDSAKL